MAQKKNFKTNPAMQFISAAEEPEAPKAQEGFTAPKGYMLVREYKTERVQLLMRPTAKAALKQIANERGISLNELANQILEDYLEEQGDL